MFSLLANANYEYKEMKLADLRNRIIEENQLTPLDILKGFHTRSNIKPEYDIKPGKDDDKVISEIHEALLKYVETDATVLAQKLYDDLFNELFKKMTDIDSTVTVEKINDGEYDSKKLGIRPEREVALSNARFHLIHTLQYDRSIQDAVTEAVQTFVNNWLAEHYPEYTIANYKYKVLPRDIELNEVNTIDFNNIYVAVDSPYSHIYGGLDSISIKVNSYVNHVKNVFTVCVDTMYRHLAKEEAESAFNNAIDAIIYANNKMGTLAYFQNLEAQPITINMNTKTGRVELIDGYKRLLYIANQTLLDYTAPIRVFTDLDDIGFLSLLYAANLWKYTANNRDIAFHDRGYLFALKTRYGFEIPEIAYKHYSNIRYYSDILAVFYTYDFDGDYYKYNLGNTQMSITDSLRHHKHTINDLYIILNELPLVSSGDHKYDRNIVNEIENFIIRTVGRIRRLPNSDDQKDLKVETLSEIFDDELIIKECCKKHLSSDTYVKNHLENKKLYDRITDILVNSLN